MLSHPNLVFEMSSDESIGFESEIHLQCSLDDPSSLHITRFNIYPKFKNSLNSDNKNLTRILPNGNYEPCISDAPNNFVDIIHTAKSSLPLVGLQIWRGALALGEFFLNNPQLIQDSIGLEIGCGTGLSSILFSRHAEKCYFTDYDESVLENCLRNIDINRSWFSPQHQLLARKFDLLEPFPPLIADNKFSFTSVEIEEIKSSKLIIFGADIFYDELLTKSFFEKLEFLLHKEARCFISIEKRINFTIKYMRPVCENYEYFRTFIDVEGELGDKIFVGKQIHKTSTSKYLAYERVDDLELWEIKKRSH